MIIDLLEVGTKRRIVHVPLLTAIIVGRIRAVVMKGDINNFSRHW